MLIRNRSSSVILTGNENQQLISHLLRPDGQEDLCFATYVPSNGSARFTGILSKAVLPFGDERVVHGNVSFKSKYFERVLRIASERKEGIAFLHSHPSPGWQWMSEDDETAELRIAPAIKAVTDLPLLGLTVGSDKTWSARFWFKDSLLKRKYNPNWCESVRVVDKNLKVIFNDKILQPQIDGESQIRTIAAWGSKTQMDISRLKIGIVGLGSVGSIVAKILAKNGVAHFTLIDFDTVEFKNIDRMEVVKDDIGLPKVEAIPAILPFRNMILQNCSAPEVNVCAINTSICEEKGFREALNCDILFSCVDRPWPRQVLNFIAYGHLIPVIDGGILVRTNSDNTRIKGAEWKAQTIGYKRVCLECLGQYNAANAKLEGDCFLDDPSYIAGMKERLEFDVHENVYAFSSNLASMEVLQMLSLIVSPSGVSDVGQQTFHFVTGRLDVEAGKTCHPNCFFPTIVGRGDYAAVKPYL